MMPSKNDRCNNLFLGLLLTCGIVVNLFASCNSAPIMEDCATGITSCQCMFLDNYDTREGTNHRVIYKVNCDKQKLTTFPNLTSLALHNLPIVKISLRGNRINEIPAGMFSGLKVRSIYLNGNGLKRIHAEAFRGMTAFDIFTLNLEYNDLFSLPSGLFSPMMKQHTDLGLPMIRVYAANNLRLHLSDGVFSGVETQVDILDLSNTNLTRVPTELLRPLRSLKELFLSYNFIKSIGPGDFPYLPVLEYLHLSDNDMEYIDTEAFSELQNIVSLSVSYNILTSLSFLKGPCHFRKLRAVDAEANPLMCDCDLFTLIRANTIRVFGACDKPTSLAGSMLSYSVDEGGKPNYSVLEDKGRGLCGVPKAPLRQWYDCDCNMAWPTFDSFVRNKGSCLVDGTAAQGPTYDKDSQKHPTNEPDNSGAASNPLLITFVAAFAFLDVARRLVFTS